MIYDGDEDEKDEDCDYEYGNIYDDMKGMKLNLTVKTLLFYLSSEDHGDKQDDADFDKEIIF